MRKDKENNFYSLKEAQSPSDREEGLFKNLSEKLLKICSSSYGWKTRLKDTNLELIKTREDLQNIPITRKSNLTKVQTQSLPYAGFNTKKPNEFDYMFASPGPIYEPGDRGDFWNIKSCLHAAGLRKGDLVYNTFSYHLGPAGIMFGNSANEIGCPVIPGGIGNTDLQITTIETLRPDFYIGTPSFLKIILDKIYEKKLEISFLKNALVGAEPFPKQLRENFKEKYKISPTQMYGIAEVGCIAFETKDKNNNINEGMVVEESIILEIIKPGSNLQAQPGEVGEVVVTKLDTYYPMIRLATGDLSSIIDEPSPCGRTNYRIKGWMGRAEQSTKVKGLFITPEQIQKISKVFTNIIKSKLIISSKNFKDHSLLVCEVRDNFEVSEEEIKNFFKNNFKLNVDIKLVKKNEIPNDGIVIEDQRNQN